MKPDHRHGAGGSSSASANSSSNGCTSNNDVMGHLQTPPPTQLPFLPTLHHYSSGDYVSGGTGLHFGATPSSLVVRNGNTSGAGSDAEFQIGTNGGSVLSNGLAAQWRLPSLQQVHQQFPNFLTNLEPQVGLFQFDHGENAEYVRDHGGRFRSNNKAIDDSSAGGIMPQVNTAKMEENNQGLSLSKNILGSGSSGNDLFWSGSGNAWSEVPSFTSSSSHLL